MSIVTKAVSVVHPEFAHIVACQEKLQSMIGPYGASPYAISEFLDSLDHNTRLACTRSLSGSHLKRLYDMVAGFKKITIDDVCPPSAGVLKEVRNYGKNSLPLFSIFEKRFARPSEGAKELWGYNFAPLLPIIGPGYFVARDAADRGEIDVDYYSVPPVQPDIADWPKLQPNEQGLSKLVYAYMVDKVRGVSKNVNIGRAWKQGKIQPAWFILCRE